MMTKIEIEERRAALVQAVRDLKYNYDVIAGSSDAEERQEAAQLAAQLRTARRRLTVFEKRQYKPPRPDAAPAAAQAAGPAVRSYMVTTPDGATMDQADELTSNSQVLDFIEGPGLTPAGALAAFKERAAGYGAFDSFEVYELAGGSVDAAARG